MRADVRALFRTSIKFTSEFPMLHVRKKLRQNVREMFLAHRHIHDAEQITCLVKQGYNDLQTLKSIAGQDEIFYELIARKPKGV